MARAKKSKANADDARPLEELSPAERIGREILTDFGDLAPSVKRILHAELDEPDRHQAMLLFKASLTGTGDPNRDPRVAIDNGRGNGAAPVVADSAPV